MRVVSLAIAVLSAWCFGFSGAMAKFLGEAGLAPTQAVWVRLMGAGLLLLGVLALARPRALWIPRARLPFLAAYAVMAIAGAQTLFFIAITRLPVGVALLLEFTAPVLVVLWVRFVRRIRLPRSAFVGAAVAVAGLSIVVEVWQGLRLDALGLFLGLLSAVCCAGYFLLSDSFEADVDPLGVMAWGMFGAAVALAPVSRPWEIRWSVFREQVTVGDRTLPVLVALLVLILVATLAAYILGVTAVRRLSAAVGATVASLEVVMGAVIAWVVLGEHLGMAQIVGGVVLLAGALLAQVATVRPRRPVPETPVPEIPVPETPAPESRAPGRTQVRTEAEPAVG
jgi:drug/metabolite transporter (DMT)-like permease